MVSEYSIAFIVMNGPSTEKFILVYQFERQGSQALGILNSVAEPKGVSSQV